MFLIFNEGVVFNLDKFHRFEAKANESGECFIYFYGFIENPGQYTSWVKVDPERMDDVLKSIFYGLTKGCSAIHVNCGCAP